MILYSAYPTTRAVVPSTILENRIFPVAFATNPTVMAIKVYIFIKEYGKLLLVAYGLIPMALGVSILYSESIHSLNDLYPQLLEWMQNEECFVISCVQLGFMLYFLYSRKLVSTLMGQTVCKDYHKTLLFCVFRRDPIRWMVVVGDAIRSSDSTRNSYDWHFSWVCVQVVQDYKSRSFFIQASRSIETTQEFGPMAVCFNQLGSSSLVP